MALFGKKNANYISAKETKRISKENRKITNEIEKKRNRKNIPESEYITTMKNPENVVEFDNVHTYFFTDIGTVKAVDGVSFEIPQGKTVGVVGESGCGKSVTSLSLMQLVQRPQGQTVEGDLTNNTRTFLIRFVTGVSNTEHTVKNTAVHRFAHCIHCDSAQCGYGGNFRSRSQRKQSANCQDHINRGS